MSDFHKKALKKIGGGIGAIFGGVPGAFIGGGIGEQVGGGGDDGGGGGGGQSGSAIDFFQQNFPEFGDIFGQNAPGIQQLQQDALRQGPSPFARIGEQQLLTEEQALRESLLAQSQARGAEASSALAARGGLSSGAQERIEETTAQAGILGGQEVGRQGLFARLELQLKDEANRQGRVGELAQLEITNELARNEFALGKFGQLASLFGAEQQARAIENQKNPTILDQFFGIFS